MPELTASVLINAYNYRRFIGEAIDSALAQTRAPLEVIVVDDGSSDGTADWVETAFCARHASVRVIAQANAGQMAAMQTGVAAARGAVLFFLDADDTWKPAYLETVLRRMEAGQGPDYVFTGHARSDARPSQVLGEKGSRVLGRRSAQAYVTGKFPISMTSTLAMRTELARRFLPVAPEILPEWKTDADQVLALGAALAGGRCAFLADELVNYRIHGANHFAGGDGKITDAVREARRARNERARVALVARLGLGPETASRIVDEFATIERPKWRECRRALRTAGASPAGVCSRAVSAMQILGRFIFSR